MLSGKYEAIEQRLQTALGWLTRDAHPRCRAEEGLGGYPTRVGVWRLPGSDRGHVITNYVRRLLPLGCLHWLARMYAAAP